MKVVHLTSAHKDGDVRIFHKECVSLAEAGHHVTLIIPNTESRVEKNVTIVSFPLVHKKRIKRMWSTVNAVYKEAKKVDGDVYHFHDPELLRIALKLKRRGKKVIYDVHEDLPRQILAKTYINKFLRKIVSWSIEKYENYVSKRLAAIVTATPHINNRFLAVNPNAHNINNFPLSSEFTVDTPIATKRENKVCYIGGIGIVRGIKEMINAAGISGAELQIAGSWSDSLKANMQKENGWDKVKELGYISREEGMEVKKNSLAGLLIFHPIPNHVNAQPNKMFEYMSSGLPVIASDFPLWKEIIESNNCGICVDGSKPEKIAEAISYLRENPDKIKEMGENGRRVVIEKYNWDNEKLKLIQLYQNL